MTAPAVACPCAVVVEPTRGRAITPGVELRVREMLAIALVAVATCDVARAQDATAPEGEAQPEASDGRAPDEHAAEPTEVEPHGHVHPHAHVHAHAHPHDDALDAEDEDDGSETEHAHVHGLEFGATATARPGVTTVIPAAASDYRLRLGLLREVPRTSAESLLSLAPGVALVNHSGQYHASSVFLRGFDAGEGQDLEVIVDGIALNEPSNAHGHGYADTHFLIPELVSAIRVIQGPFAPDQSDFAVAGTAHYTLGVESRGVRLAGHYGSFDSYRALALWAPVGAREGTFVAGDLRGSRGFGVARASSSAALNARYEAELAPALLGHLFGAIAHADFASAGVVREDDVAAARLSSCDGSRDGQFFCTPDPRQGGASTRALLSAGLEWQRPGMRFTQSLWGGYRRLRVRENYTGVLLDERGDRLDEHYEAGTVGLRGAVRFETRLLDQPQQLELGWVARHDSGTTRLFRERWAEDVPWTALIDDELHVTHVGGHVAIDARFFDWLALRAGVRADAFAFSTLDRAEPERDREGERLPLRGADAFGVSVQPRGTLRARLWSPARDQGLEWQTSGGVGTRSSDATALSDGEFAPFARAIAIETGLSLRLAELDRLELEARVAAFHTHVDRDLLFDATRGRNVYAAATSRLGAQAFARVRWERWLDVAASFAWTEAFVLRGRDDWIDWVSQERVPYVPRWVARLDAAMAHDVDLGGAERITLAASLGIGALGERPLPLGATAAPLVQRASSVRVG